MADEQKWQEQGSHTLCANNCGFFGSPTTLNLCSKCYKDHCLKERQMKDAQLAVEKTLAQPKPDPLDSSSSSSSLVVELDDSNATVGTKDRAVGVAAPVAEAPAPAGPLQQPNRCGACSRRVGITGFKCRCGITYCGGHRYPEQHGCTFDYKAMGREAIAKANPLIKAPKLHKI